MGYIIKLGIIRIDSEKINIILEWPILKNISNIWGYTGFIAYYYSYIKDYLYITAKLTNIIRGNPPKFY